jgi:hypothetical protein
LTAGVLCFLKVWRAKCLNWSIVTRAQVQRQCVWATNGGEPLAYPRQRLTFEVLTLSFDFDV